MRKAVFFVISALLLMLGWLWVTSTVWSQAPAPQPPSPAQILEDVTRTKHNLSSVSPDQILSSATAPRPGTSREIFSPETTEICVFCHTPHGASSVATSLLRAPIWNRNLSEANYQLYDQVWSRSFEGKLHPGAPTGFSRLCLSCHDGTIALGALRNAPGSGGFRQDLTQNPPLQMEYAQGVSAPFPFGSIPEGSGTATGNTRRLGIDLKNDHPISFVYDNALAGVDKELTLPGNPPAKPAEERSYPAGIGPMRRYDGETLGRFDSIQCTSCHNPHQVNYPKFLRANWLQNAQEHPGEQIICVFCHDKPGWIESTHAVATAVRNTYPDNGQSDPTRGYDFDGAHSVREYACRSCHDPHTAQGAKRLHREGVDTPGGMDAIENTCYLCHAPNTAAIPTFFAPAGDPTTPSNTRFLTGSGRPAPDVFTQFAKDSNLGGRGSAMNLRLAQGHEPVFTSYPREGVELNSPFQPPFNKFAAGSGAGGTPPSLDPSPDPRHVECVDCHNPHQVVASNRLKGMRGITYNGLVVGHDSQETGCQPGPCNREPYVFEVCFRCHGNSVTNIFQGDRTEDTAPNYYRSNPLIPATNPNLSLKGFSNKRLEFATYGNFSSEISATSDPQRGSFAEGTFWGNDTTGFRRIGPGVNKAFHPVVAPGRNATPALCKQLSRAFGLTGCETSPGAELALSHLSQLTIQCTDCHNNEHYDAYQGGGGLIKPQLLGPMTESNLRATDFKKDGTKPGISDPAVIDYDTERSREPIGPHGSSHIRILRASYNTNIANPSRNYQNDGFNASHTNNFLLCFQCHAREAFDPSVAGANPNDPSLTNFFGVPVSPQDSGQIEVGLLSWESNLHMYHLQRTGAYCHECHYNIHSNAQATNTIYGDGTGCIGGTPNCPAGLPPDAEDGVVDGVSDTHLINFAPGGPTNYSGERKCNEDPEAPGADASCAGSPAGDPNPGNVTTRFDVFAGVEGVTAQMPVWYYDASVSPARIRCNMRCHGVVMSTCFYITDRTVDKDMNIGQNWCAGGQSQRPQINFGAIPEEVRDLVAKLGQEQPASENLPQELRQYVTELERRGADHVSRGESKRVRASIKKSK